MPRRMVGIEKDVKEGVNDKKHSVYMSVVRKRLKVLSFLSAKDIIVLV